MRMVLPSSDFRIVASFAQPMPKSSQRCHRSRLLSVPVTLSGLNRRRDGMCLVWICRILSLPDLSIFQTCTSRSNRPDLISAGSTISRRFVAATTTTFRSDWRPSSSVSSWLSTRSVTTDSLIPRAGASASSSSKNMIAGETCFAFLNTSRIAFSDSPTHFESSWGPLTLMKLAFDSFAAALTSRVFPVPGGPCRRIPFGGVMPIFSNFCGFLSGHSITS